VATRQIIVLDCSLDATGKTLTVTFIAWLACAATRINALPNFVSQVPPAASVAWGITSAELALLVAGTIVEQRASCTFDMTQGQPTIGQMQASVAAKYASLETALANEAYTVAHVVGAYWDGTTWTAGP